MKRGRKHAVWWRECSIHVLGPPSSPTKVKNLLFLITSINMLMFTLVNQKTFCSTHLRCGFMHPVISRSCLIMWRYVINLLYLLKMNRRSYFSITISLFFFSKNETWYIFLFYTLCFLPLFLWGLIRKITFIDLLISFQLSTCSTPICFYLSA